MLRQQSHQRLREVAAGDIVDPAIALGLADHRDDLGSTDDASHDQPLQFGEVTGMGHGKPVNARRFHCVPPSLINSNSRLGLKGISRSSTFLPLSSSASSIACANIAPTGMAPASPAPLMPSGLSGDSVTVCAISICGTSSAVGSR